MTAKKFAASSSCGSNTMSTPSYVSGTLFGSYGGGNTTPWCSKVFHCFFVPFFPFHGSATDRATFADAGRGLDAGDLGFGFGLDGFGFGFGFDADDGFDFFASDPIGTSSSLSLSALRFFSAVDGIIALRAALRIGGGGANRAARGTSSLSL
eukprot:29971-Pelagococcus_subviridis.AAC.7